ncbi:MAG: deoxyribose-phosphate aldolase [Planctomycetota bacterium]|jgi:deoxyribose-phosphate aldolase
MADGLAAAIEHTLLRCDASRAEIHRLLEEAVRWECHGVCVQPYWVATLKDAPIPVISVTGFPFGADRADHKAHGAARARDDGAVEIDMVVNVGALKSGDWSAFAADIAAVRAAVPDLVLKTILETGALTDAERDRAARVAREEGVDILKTCTGYGPRGATVEDVAALVPFGPVKASAGIRTREQAVALMEAGATRLGTSAAAAILGKTDEAHG